MHVQPIVRHLLRSCREFVHVARLLAVVSTVEAIVRAGRLTVAALGRVVPGRARPKHGIKRVDRLLSNGRLYRERLIYFAAMAHRILGGERRPVVAVDWTSTGPLRALYAAVPIGGRAVTIYLEVHPEAKLGNTGVQQRFLAALSRVLPVGCRPIVVSDAGFHGPFFRDVVALGWDFVGRLRGTARYRPAGGGRVVSKEQLYARATVTAQDLGQFDLYTRARSVAAKLVLVRKRRKPGPRSVPTLSKDEQEFTAAARDPWLLATSLSDASAAAVVAVYATRMQIEETFRDAKNFRHGWCLRHTNIRNARRLTVMLVLAAIATLAVTLLGLAAEGIGLHRRYQANTVANRVLSFFVLGQALIRRGDHRALLSRQALGSALRQLHVAVSAFTLAGNPS
jgi:hypothetical protein